MDEVTRKRWKRQYGETAFLEVWLLVGAGLIASVPILGLLVVIVRDLVGAP